MQKTAPKLETNLLQPVHIWKRKKKGAERAKTALELLIFASAMAATHQTDASWISTAWAVTGALMVANRLMESRMQNKIFAKKKEEVSAVFFKLIHMESPTLDRADTDRILNNLLGDPQIREWILEDIRETKMSLELHPKKQEVVWKFHQTPRDPDVNGFIARAQMAILGNSVVDLDSITLKNGKFEWSCCPIPMPKEFFPYLMESKTLFEAVESAAEDLPDLTFQYPPTTFEREIRKMLDPSFEISSTVRGGMLPIVRSASMEVEPKLFEGDWILEGGSILSIGQENGKIYAQVTSPDGQNQSQRIPHPTIASIEKVYGDLVVGKKESPGIGM